jgi:uncharacterized membrane protein YebE (DUF533 family)
VNAEIAKWALNAEIAEIAEEVYLISRSRVEWQSVLEKIFLRGLRDLRVKSRAGAHRS